MPAFMIVVYNAVHCATAADHTLAGAGPAAKKHEVSPAPARHTVNRCSATQNMAPKFGVLVCFSHN